jgi:hypothetical protein
VRRSAIGQQEYWQPLVSFGDFPFSGPAVRPHAIAFSASCRMDPMVLAGFRLVAGELLPPWGRTPLIVWRGGSN